MTEEKQTQPSDPITEALNILDEIASAVVQSPWCEPELARRLNHGNNPTAAARAELEAKDRALEAADALADGCEKCAQQVHLRAAYRKARAARAALTE